MNRLASVLPITYCVIEFDVSDLNGPSSGLFNNFKNNVVSVGNSSIYTALLFVAVLAVISLAITILRTIFGDPKNRSSAKKEIFVIIMATIAAFGVIGIVKLLSDIGGNLF